MDIQFLEEDSRGLLRKPDGPGPFPGVVALGGSDGGTPTYFLDLFVPDGFACLAMTYWGTRDTQMVFTEIPLERIARGLRWLASQPDVLTHDGRVALVGASRGAELALLLASTYPDLVGPVVAYTPSSVVWVGVDMSLPPGTTRSSWSYGGTPIPYLRFPRGSVPSQSERGVSILAMCEAALDNMTEAENAAILVERSSGPLLLVSGGDDHVWPAARMSDMIAERMDSSGRSADVAQLLYPEAGHMLFPYSRPVDTEVPEMPTDLGGTPVADHTAHTDAWTRVLSHLQTTGQ